MLHTVHIPGQDIQTESVSGLLQEHGFRYRATMKLRYMVTTTLLVKIINMLSLY